MNQHITRQSRSKNSKEAAKFKVGMEEKAYIKILMKDIIKILP